MEQAHFFYGCLEDESFSLLPLDICLPVPVGASSEWERVGASAGPQSQLELLSLSKPGGTAGREQLAREGCSHCDLSCEGRPRGRESSW